MTVNIAVWVYFFMKIQTHRDIRYDEIYAQMMYKEEDKSKEQKEQHLTKFKEKSQVIYIVVAIFATFLSAIYIYFAVMIPKDVFEPDPRASAIDFYSDYNNYRTVQCIFSTIFSVMIILMSLLVMCKLRIRFDDFYAEYGCLLWAVFTIQALSMLIQATTEFLRMYDQAVIDLPLKMKLVPYSILVVTVNVVTMIVTMITQLNCLIFGWVRHRRGVN